MNMFEPYLSKEIEFNLNKVIQSTYLGEGEVVEEFEAELTKVLGFNNPVAVNSGTSALHMALELSGVSYGDEVIIPAQTFIATGLSVLMSRAKPVFADIDLNTGNISPSSVLEKITTRTKAIIAVHWGGYPCDMDALSEICKKHHIVLIEDAAHAVGAVYKGELIGTISDFTAFSFQSIKHLTTGDGGALCCKLDKHYHQAKKMRWFGIDRASNINTIGERVYDVDRLSFKYHMNNVSAAIGLANITNIHSRLKRRRDIAEFYSNKISRYNDIILPVCDDNLVSSHWFFPILTKHRDKLIKHLRLNGAIASVVNQGIDKNSIFNNKENNLTNQRVYEKNFMALPMHDNLTDSDIEKIVLLIDSFFKKIIP